MRRMCVILCVHACVRTRARVTVEKELEGGRRDSEVQSMGTCTRRRSSECSLCHTKRHICMCFCLIVYHDVCVFALLSRCDTDLDTSWSFTCLA